MIYIREAHPTDGRQVGSNRKSKVLYKQATTLNQRKNTAKACKVGLKINIPIIVDGMNNAANRAYGGWPDRLYIVGTDGRIAWRGGRGPRGFRPADMEAELVKLIGGTPAAKGKPKAGAK